MGFFSKIFNPNGRTARLEKLQNELSEFYAQYQGLSANEISDKFMEDTFSGLSDALSGKGPSSQARKAKDHRQEAARLEYLDLCLENETISLLVESNEDSPDDLWEITQEMAAEGLCGKVGSKWMHLEVIADEIALFAYYGAKLKDLSNLEISQILMSYFKGRLDPDEMLAYISNKPDPEISSSENNTSRSNTSSMYDPEDAFWESIWESVDSLSEVISESLCNVNSTFERIPHFVFSITAAAMTSHIFPILFPEEKSADYLGVFTEVVRDNYINGIPDATPQDISLATTAYIELLTNTGKHIKTALSGGGNPLHSYQKALEFIHFHIIGEIEGSTPPMTVATIAIAEEYQANLQALIPHIENITGVSIETA